MLAVSLKTQKTELGQMQLGNLTSRRARTKRREKRTTAPVWNWLSKKLGQIKLLCFRLYSQKHRDGGAEIFYYWIISFRERERAGGEESGKKALKLGHYRANTRPGPSTVLTESEESLRKFARQHSRNSHSQQPTKPIH